MNITQTLSAEFGMKETHAENIIALGSDFDGAEIPRSFDRVEKIPVIRDYLAGRGIAETILDKLFFNNAFRFLMRSLP